MDKTLANILEASGLSPEIITSLQEAFDKKVAEAREEAELSLREEMARRFEHDKANLVEAMDRMLSDVVAKHDADRSAEVAKFVEARDTYRAAVKEARQNYKTKLREHLSITKKYAMDQLVAETASLRAEKKSIVEAKAKMAKELTALKEAAIKNQAERFAKIDKFVVEQVGKELKEFGEDRRALVETRARIIGESKKKLRETQLKFVRESAAKVEKMVNESLRAEMAELHEDVERNRQNVFGRRIFEAVAAEYMNSYLAEGTEVKKLTAVLEGKQAELAQVKSKLSEVQKATDTIRRKAQLAEAEAERSKIMAELLSPIRGERRVVMEGMLDTVKTENLRSAFKRILPVVMNESRKPAAQAPANARTLMETKKTEKREVTGDRAARKIFESAPAEEELDPEIGQVLRLAGIQK